jgi:hypothetical protein
MFNKGTQSSGGNLAGNSIPRPQAGNGAMMSEHKKYVKICIMIAALLAVICLGCWGWRMIQNDGIMRDRYQAVFLTNGQVYFGHLSDTRDDYVRINDIYYLQVQQSVQPQDAQKTDDQQKVSLAKLGGELHGPENQMVINRSQVLFWENLKNDSKVVKAIQENQKK